MSIENILVIDDEPLIRSFLEELLKKHLYHVISTQNGDEAKQLIKKHHFDLIITDMNLPNTTGNDILSYSKKFSPETIVLVITGHGSIENAVEAMRLGAFNYLLKPFSPETLLTFIDKAKEHLSLVKENSFFRQENSSLTENDLFISNSSQMKQVISQARLAANSKANIFIQGESGSGKEVLARFIHNHSPRHREPYIKVNCAAIPETLMESEFFGHEKGAFTGAIVKKPGRFELANKGTILLDEITETPLSLQPKLLRAIQEKEFERVGGTKPISIDVRILATSNRDLKQAVKESIFRQDLYYRLNVISLKIPPLRERHDDIIPLAKKLLFSICKNNGKKLKQLSNEGEKTLLSYHFPGNVRELSNILERAVILDSSSTIDREHLLLDC